MKVHVQIIPLHPNKQTHISHDLGPPITRLWHYTTGNKLRLILLSGQIKPSTAGIESHEKPVAWYSTSPHWEPTATKCPIPGMPGQLITAEAQHGLARITVPASCAPYGFGDLPRIAGTSHETCRGLLLVGLELGSDPTTWRFTPEPVSAGFFWEVEFYDFARDRWLAVDLAELACRN